MPITRGRQVVCPTWRRKIRTVPSRPSPTSGVLPKDENIPVLRRQNQSYNELTNIERMEEIRTANSIYPHLPQHESSLLHERAFRCRRYRCLLSTTNTTQFQSHLSSYTSPHIPHHVSREGINGGCCLDR